MSPPSCACAPVRPSVVVNAEIHRLCKVTPRWTAEARAEYARLVAEWAAAMAREQADAA